MKIKLTSVMVDDQGKALRFYTDVLGFAKRRDSPVGEFRWISLIAPDGHPDVELALEPNVNPAGRAFQTAMFEQGIPIAAFEVEDVDQEFRRLKARGVVFSVEPTQAGQITLAIFADTCGNLIQMYSPPSG